jgi:hypothetical protein
VGGCCKAVYFSEERRCDSIVVYVGEYSMQSISADAYKNGRFFSDMSEAVVYVLEQAYNLFPAGRFDK